MSIGLLVRLVGAGTGIVREVTIGPGRDTDEVPTGYVRSDVDGARALGTTDETLLDEVAFADAGRRPGP